VGDPHPLMHRLGSPAGLQSLEAVLPGGSVTNLASLRRFLDGYRDRVLVPVELPAIQRAFWHVSEYELRELLALDSQLAAEPALSTFSAASQAVGRSRLHRLRPLRDQRLVQRYLQSVDAGAALGWHMLVYGLVLSVYSLPLRQGLMHYTSRTLGQFLHAAARPLRLGQAECAALQDENQAPLAMAVNATLARHSVLRPCGVPAPIRPPA
jgi:urease accessory protein UreF